MFISLAMSWSSGCGMLGVGVGCYGVGVFRAGGRSTPNNFNFKVEPLSNYFRVSLSWKVPTHYKAVVYYFALSYESFPHSRIKQASFVFSFLFKILSMLVTFYGWRVVYCTALLY